MELKERFLKYVAINTRSDENSETFPSTAVQWDLLNTLVEEMKLLGLEDVTIDKYGYAMGTIPATPGKGGRSCNRFSCPCRYCTRYEWREC